MTVLPGAGRATGHRFGRRLVADLATLAPAGGVALTLAVVIGYLLKSNAADRAAYQEATDRAEERFDEMAERLRRVNAALDVEIDARRKAEDAKAVSERTLNDLRHRAERPRRDQQRTADRPPHDNS